jgi:long-chain fatty acid transport protein
MNDLSFTTSSNNMGFGARVRLTSKLNLDLGYMKTFYEDRTVETKDKPVKGLTKTDTYSRTNRVFGIGVNFEF